jgi:hypothetical protein
LLRPVKFAAREMKTASYAVIGRLRIDVVEIEMAASDVPRGRMNASTADESLLVACALRVYSKN